MFFGKVGKGLKSAIDIFYNQRTKSELGCQGIKDVRKLCQK